MISGNVLFWPDFKYKGGGQPTPKLILIAGIDKYGDALLYRTTSRDGGYRPDNEGCHSNESVYRFKNNPMPFNIPTWVQFEDPYVYSIKDIQNLGVEVKFSLTEIQLRAVINCIKQSEDYANWLKDYGV